MASRSLVLLLLVSLGAFDPAVAADDDVLQLNDDSSENGDACKDCTEILELMGDLLTNRQLQKKLVEAAESLCERLPGPQRTTEICKAEVEKMIPLALHFLTTVIKPAKVCKVLGLCRSCDEQLKMLNYFVNEALEAAGESENAPQRNVCSFCLFLMKALEDLLPKKRTEDAVMHLLEDICHILPASQQKLCQDIVDKFSKIIIDAILSYATPRSICELLHLCKSQDATPLDPCTVEAYRCKDVNTALRCGTLFYCQKFSWKSDHI